jgi:UDP-3-O-[3-hydroxymyristoyl] glucosamine N-acyltransferase
VELTARQIADHIHGEIVGNPKTVVTGVSGIKEARPGDLTFIHNPKYAKDARDTKASVVVVGRDWETTVSATLVRVDSPSLGFAQACELIARPLRVTFPPGVSPRAHVSPKATLGKNVSIQPFAVIEDGAVIGDRTVIGAGVYIGHETRVGADCLFYANACVRERCVVGDRVIVHHNASIGADGYGYATVDGVHHKIPQIGTVEIGDDVEIGACTTVDRGRFGKTVIGRGTKIDNLVQIAHNVVIGEHCLIVSQVGISGSTEIGNHVVIAGQAGLVGHIKIGDGAVIMARSGVAADVPPGARVLGAPAMPEREAKRVLLSSVRLPDLIERVRKLEEQLKQAQPK